jgi:monoamine oxidase
VGFNAGRFAMELERMSDRQILDSGMNTLRKIYGKIPTLQSYLITRWQSDPFALGSYSYIAPGASNRDRQALANPVNKLLFFAGEATSQDYAATVHGAFLSGKRAAQQISRLIS